MPPSGTRASNPGKASYKTYEAQARLVRAMVAAHPETRWNYKEIVACYGSDLTEPALNHRFRHIRAEALIIREGRKLGFDMRALPFEDTLPGTQGAVDKKNIAKYFGQSTPDGIQFQFRAIKKDADKLRKVEADGGDVAAALTAELQGGSTTPLAVTPSKTPRRRGPIASGSAMKSTKKTDFVQIKAEDLEDSDSENSGMETPSKRPKLSEVDGSCTPQPKKRNAATAGLPVRPVTGTPSRVGADGMINASSQASSSATNDNDTTPASSDPASTGDNALASIFGPISPKIKSRAKANESISPFKAGSTDAFAGSQASMYTNASFVMPDEQDGEI